MIGKEYKINSSETGRLRKYSMRENNNRPYSGICIYELGCNSNLSKIIGQDIIKED